jgi:hypothetical protein
MAIHTGSLDSPDEQRTPDKTRMDIVTLPDISIARITLEPGWRWSECIRPVVGGDSCQVRHVGALLAGEMEVVHDDGTKARLKAGDVYVIEPGHDAWVVGDEPAVELEFDRTAAETFAKA